MERRKIHIEDYAAYLYNRRHVHEDSQEPMLGMLNIENASNIVNSIERYVVANAVLFGWDVAQLDCPIKSCDTVGAVADVLLGW